MLKGYFHQRLFSRDSGEIANQHSRQGNPAWGKGI
jgi:hypothetical protein